jgi:hypothetical protein
MQIQKYVKTLIFSFLVLVGCFAANDNTQAVSQLTKQHSSMLVLESSDINTVLKYADNEKTLVIFDIDNTLLKARARYATDAWFSEMVKYAETLGYKGDDAVAVFLPHYCNALINGGADIVDTKATATIKALQAKKITVIALSARSETLMECSFKQFASAGTDGIDLSVNGLSTKELVFPMNRGDAYFRKGIGFCGNNDKADVLDLVLRTTKSTPKKIVYIDDKLKHVMGISKYAQAHGINFVGIRYSYLDDEVKAFVLDDESKKLIPLKQAEPTPQIAIVS